MVLNRSVMLATALTVTLAGLTPARAEVGECNNKPGACGIETPSPRRAPPPVARPAPPPQARPAPPSQPVVRAPQQPQRTYPTARAPQEPDRRSFGQNRGEYRRERGDYDRGRGYSGRAIGAGAVIIGSIIAYSAYRGSNRDYVYARCDRNFPDFDYETGTFINEDGNRETCPYLY